MDYNQTQLRQPQTQLRKYNVLNIYAIIGGLVSVLGLVLAAFFSAKKSGSDEQKVKTLTQEASDNAKLINDIERANDARNNVTLLARVRKQFQRD